MLARARVIKFKKVNKYTIGTLKYIAQEGGADRYNSIKREHDALADVFDDGHQYPVIDIGTPFLTTKKEASDDMNAGQKVVKRRLISSCMDLPTHSY